MSHQFTKICSFEGCLKKSRCNGLCNGHASQSWLGKPLAPLGLTKRRNGSPPRIICDEVPCPVPELGHCHVFRGGRIGNGYGTVGIGNKKIVLVHRYVWEKVNGPIPDDLVTDHMCRVRSCCNIEHLRLVTRQVNSTENVSGMSWQIHKAKTHCKYGHPFDEANTYWHGKHRQCRICKRNEDRRRHGRI